MESNNVRMPLFENKELNRLKILMRESISMASKMDITFTHDQMESNINMREIGKTVREAEKEQ